MIKKIKRCQVLYNSSDQELWIYWSVIDYSFFCSTLTIHSQASDALIVMNQITVSIWSTYLSFVDPDVRDLTR